MAKRLTDKQRKRIIADRVEGLSQRALAKKYKVSTTTIQRVLKSNPDLAQMVAQKIEEESADFLVHLEKKRELVNRVVDRYLGALLDEERIARATPSQLTTALGTLIDKWTQGSRGSGRPSVQDDALTEGLRTLAADLEKRRDSGAQS